MAGADRRKTLAVTVVDKWRRYHEDDDMTLEAFRKDLLDRTSSAPAVAGTAGHKILELAAHDEVLEHGAFLTVDVEHKDGRHEAVDLSFEMADAHLLALPPIPEGKVEKTYVTAIGEVIVKGRTDGFDGIEVLDFKFTGKPDLEELERSWQWRLYLDMLGAQRFRWEVFTMRPPLKSETAWRVVDRQTARQYRYPGMEQDVARVVNQTAKMIDLYVPEYWARNAHLEGGDDV